MDALANTMEDIRTNTDQLPQELVITTATDEWLDTWGEWFGVKRRLNETDDDFRSRILGTLTQERLTIPAIITLTKNVLGQDTNVTVTETYTQVMVYNTTTWNEYRYQDGDYYRVGVVNVTVDKEPTSELAALLNLLKAAGTKIIVTYQP